MAIHLNGSQFQGGGKTVTIDPATYPATLKGMRAYRDWNFEKTDTQPKLDLIWDTGLMVENDDGEEVEAIVYDSFIVLSLNEKSNLTKRLSALLGKDYDPMTANLTIEIDGTDDLAALPMREDGRKDVTRFEIDGQSVFGKEALIQVDVNKNNYNRVTNVSAPLKSGNGKMKARQPAGAPA